jgi:putative transposase
MSIYRRPRVRGATVFFTVALASRGSTLLVDEVARLRAAVRDTKGARPFEIDAWVVLPDHIHAVWTLPAGDADFSSRWGAIKARFSMAVRRAGVSSPARLPMVTAGRYAGVNPGLRHDKGEVAIWQRRFWEHHIRDEADYRAHVWYCWMNPVKHGFVERPEEWRYSSVHRDSRYVPGMDLVR